MRSSYRCDLLGYKSTVMRFLFPPVLTTALLLTACGGAATSTVIPTNTPVPTIAAQVTEWRYVNSGWLSPQESDPPGAFSRELRAFVITSQVELDEFQNNVAMKRTRGTTTSLSRIDFPQSILLAAYYLWRPLQGDPLSVVGFSFDSFQDGHRADVLLSLEESPQGKEYPYLFAPMSMVAVDRSLLPKGEPIEFVFHLDGEVMDTVTAEIP